MRIEKATFPGASGAPLAARLELPDGQARAAAIFAHCFTCSKDSLAARRIARRLTARGIAVLAFDFTGIGESGGDFATTGFSSNVGDLRAAAQWMAGRGMAPQLLIGHSLGGAAALAAAPDIPSLGAVVTIGAPADPGHVANAFADRIEEIRRAGRASVTLGGRSVEIGRELVEDIAQASLQQALPRLKAALLVLHAPRDEVVGIDNATRIFVAARHPKSFVSLDDADHMLSRPADADYVADLIASWSSRYLRLAPLPARPDAPEGVVRVSEADPDGFRQEIVVDGRHHLVADEPAAMGGTDAGPSPYQLLSAALGACTTMTIRLYARRKGFALDHVACDVSHRKVHASDCADCEDQGRRIDLFTRVLRLEGDLDRDQRAAILSIADKCPVHRTLHAPARIETSLAGEDGPARHAG
ncbi:MAG: osmotically inducible protein C [Paracoccaceae bacterium]|nr:MAG: osmotically inducible protein C [Paracoccaceae bacterium]